MEYNIHSNFTAHAPNRVDLPLSAMSADIFSKYTLVNVCPGEQLVSSNQGSRVPGRLPLTPDATQQELEKHQIIQSCALLRLQCCSTTHPPTSGLQHVALHEVS